MKMTSPSFLPLLLLLTALVFASSSFGFAPKNIDMGKVTANHGWIPSQLPKASYALKERRHSDRCRILKLAGSDKKYGDDDDTQDIRWPSVFCTISSTFSRPRAAAILSNVSSVLIPAIPEQEDGSVAVEIMQPKTYKNIANHFRLGFVRKEFHLGFTYMLRVMPTLLICSILATVVRSHFSWAAHTVDFQWKLKRRPTFYIDGLLKTVFHRVIGPEKRGSIYFFLLAPLGEELAYRGIGMLFYGVTFMMTLTFLAVACRERIALHSLWFSICFPYALRVTEDIESRGILYGISSNRFVDLLILFLCGTMVWWPIIIMDEHREDRESNTEVDDATEGERAHVDEEKDYRLQSSVVWKEWFPKKLVSIATKSPHFVPPPGFRERVSMSTILWARIRTSYDFGRAHLIPRKGSLHTVGRWIQKATGTFMSSLLVESRMVVNRGNIWAALGSHCAWNIVGAVFLYILHVVFVLPP